MAKKLTSTKARKILHDKEVHGKPLTEKQRKFFGAIAGGAKPYKAESGGWLDKYDEGGVLKQKKEDNYGVQGNYNNYDISLPDGFKGWAYNLKGRNYSPAWGGQFQMGGSLPGATGFMYARTINPAPSNGPYAKKTKASAQDGKKLSYNQWKKQYNLKETPDYNLKRAWELGYTPDKTGHLPTVDNQTGQFLKAKGHPTLQLELDWYNSPEAADFRSKNVIDSSGKFFKYVPKGQNGQEMKYYQEGLDFKPKTISQNGSRTPIVVTDPNDPRLKDYHDSLSLYNRSIADKNRYLKFINSLGMDQSKIAPTTPYYGVDYEGNNRPLTKSSVNFVGIDDKGNTLYYGKNKPDGGGQHKQVANAYMVRPGEDRRWMKINEGVWVDHDKGKKIGKGYLTYKKPVQPVILEEQPRLEKPIPIPRDTRDLGYTLPTPGQFTAPKLYKYDPDTPTKFSFTYPTGGYNEQKTMYFPTRSAWKSYVEGIKGTEKFKGSQEGVDYAQATGYLQDGGDIPVDPMGYWNPENVGEPVIIPSNVITMEGVDQPLLGISDTGDVQYMEPGEDYEFDGEYVTEYPVAQAGKRVPIIVSDPKDPRLKAYQDSLSLHNLGKKYIRDAYDRNSKLDVWLDNRSDYEKRKDLKYHIIPESTFKTPWWKSDKEGTYLGRQFNSMANKALSTNILPIGGYRAYEGPYPAFKKPVQPVEYRKPEPKQEVVKKPEPVVEKKAPLTDYFQGTSVYAPTPYHGSGAGAFVGYRTPQGDTVFVKPEDYERMAVPKYGREFIESKKKMKNGGVSVNNADAQPIKKLDQLLNFTNYNKPTKGGWLDKYN